MAGKKKSAAAAQEEAQPNEAANAQPKSLSDEVFGEGEDQIGFDQLFAEVADRVVMAEALIDGYADIVDSEEALICHTFLKAIEANAKVSIDKLKPRMLDLAMAAGGKVQHEKLGEFAGSRVSGTVEKAYTDATVDLLETKGLLNQAVTMDARLKGDVDVAAIPNEDLEVLHRYFDIDLLPSAEKINALVALGKIKATEIDETCEERETRKGHDRLTVKPSEDLAAYFHLEK